MAYYKLPDGTVTEVSSPQLNPDLIKGATQVSDLSGAITSASLTPATTENFQTPGNTTSYPLQGLITPIGQEEQKADEVSKRIQDLNLAQVGESAYQAEQNRLQNIPGLISQSNDLQAQLQGLVNQSLDLDNQYNYTIPNKMQVAAEGRGVTAGGLAPIQASELRKIQIQKGAIASQALTIKSAFEATQGRLSTAQYYADQAVKQKYEPLKREVEVLTKNLEIILNSPAYSRETKDRAQKQKDVQDAKAKEIEKQEKATKDIYDLMITAAKNGADALTLSKVREAKTPEEAALLAGKFIADTETQVINLDNGNTILANKRTGEIVKSYGGAKLTAPSGGVPTGGTLGGGTPKVSPLTQAIIENPTLFDDLTPTKRGEVTSQLQAAGYDTTNLGVKGLSDGAIKEISQTQKALADLDGLRKVIQGNENLLGPVTGLQRFNPYSQAKKIQADVDRVRQTVGKALEGGVLRKEDEEKYKKILATLADTPSTAIYKIDALIGSIQRDIENYKALQSASGRSINTRSPLQVKGKETAPTDFRAKYKY